MKANAQKNISENPAEDFAPSETRRFVSLAALENEYAQMCDRLGPAAAEDPDCELARLKIELAKAEHDRAGALKFKSFVRRNRELFLPNDEEGEGGKRYRLSEGAENRRYVLIGMGELDRLNKEGHNQAAGDAALAAVVKAAALAAGAKADDIAIYRYGGNEYMVEFPDASETDIISFEAAFRRQKLDLGEFSHLEAPSLSIVRVDFAEVLDIADSVDIIRSGAEQNDAYEAAAKNMTVFTRFAEYNLESEKFVTRVDRAIEKLKAAKEGRIAREKAEAFFDTYLKKAFYGSGLDSLAAVEDLWRDGSDSGDFARAVELLAAAAVKRRFADDRWFELYEQHLSNGIMRDYLRTVGAAEAAAEPAIDPFSSETNLAKIPDPRHGTEGLRILSQLKRQIGKRPGKWQEVDKLAYEAEAMKRDVSTGLLERGKFYDEAKERIGKGIATSLIFIDLGYLKYFDGAGRRAVGDAALLKAAEVMEEAIMESEIEAKVFRYGGDEFVIMVDGDADDAASLKKEVERVRAQAGRIPDLRSLRGQGRAMESIGDSRPDYAPMELVLNYGISDLKSVNLLLADLGEEEVASMLEKGRRSREDLCADLLVKTADAAVGYDKATSRFRELIELLRRPEYSDRNSIEHKRIESVIAASRKAIFAEHGGEEALRLWAEQRPENQKKLISDFVDDRLENMSVIRASEKELVDKLVEIHAARNRLLAEIARLNGVVAERGKTLKEEEEKIWELGARLREAEEARRAIIEARQDLGRSIDKKA